jgi:hypothetical protein
LIWYPPESSSMLVSVAVFICSLDSFIKLSSVSSPVYCPFALLPRQTNHPVDTTAVRRKSTQNFKFSFNALWWVMFYYVEPRTRIVLEPVTWLAPLAGIKHWKEIRKVWNDQYTDTSSTSLNLRPNQIRHYWMIPATSSCRQYAALLLRPLLTVWRGGRLILISQFIRAVKT